MKISVITVTWNSAATVADTLRSVNAQEHPDVEHILVDGNSTDATLSIVRAVGQRVTTLVSEPDRGIYDAMNKGVAAAHGTWVQFLGADDRLVGDMVLSEALNWMKKTEAGVAAGEAAYDDGRLYKLRAHVNPLAGNFVRHQSAFYRRSLFEENGGFDVSLAVKADYDFNVRLWKNHVRFKPLPLRIAACGARGRSNSGRWRGYGEEITVRHRYFAPWRCWFWDALSIGRFARKKIARNFSRP